MPAHTKESCWWRDTPKSEKRAIAARWQLGDKAGKMELARQLQTSYSNLNRLLSDCGYLCPPSPIEKYNKPLTATPQCVLVLSDLHIPVHDQQFVEQCVMMGHAWGMDLTVLLGDAMEFSAFSVFMAPPEHTFKREKDTGKEFLRWLSQWTPKAWWVCGNHEDRIFRTLHEHLDNEDLWAIMGSYPWLRLTPYHWCLLGPEDKYPWQLEHPRPASKIAGRVAVQLANIYTDKNIMAAHGHLSAITSSEDGKRTCIDTGVCCDDIRQDWQSLKHGTRPKFQKSAWILKRAGNEYLPYRLTPDSDFGALRRLYG